MAVQPRVVDPKLSGQPDCTTVHKGPFGFRGCIDVRVHCCACGELVDDFKMSDAFIASCNELLEGLRL
jgi:hypothetical protein